MCHSHASRKILLAQALCAGHSLPALTAFTQEDQHNRSRLIRRCQIRPDDVTVAMMSGRPILAMASDTCASASGALIWSSSRKHLQTASTCPALMSSVTMRVSTSPRPSLRHTINVIICDYDSIYVLLLPQYASCDCRQSAARCCQNCTHC